MDLRIVVLCLLFLSACSTVNQSPQRDESPQRGESLQRGEVRDGGPARPVDVSHINDAAPSPVIRTRAGNAKVYTVLGKTYRTMEHSHGYQERGIASWYGTKFHGKRTANGEVYDMLAMTAAHKVLPIPSYVRVTNVNNGTSVVVRINDRGPFHSNRIIDLSYAAARKLGIAAAGTGLVDVVDVTPSTDALNSSSVAPSPTSFNPLTPSPISNTQKVTHALGRSAQQLTGLYYLQLGAFQALVSAQSLRSQLVEIISDPINVIEGRDKLYRVTLGPIKDEQQIVHWQQVLQRNGIGIGYVVRR